MRHKSRMEQDEFYEYEDDEAFPDESEPVELDDVLEPYDDGNEDEYTEPVYNNELYEDYDEGYNEPEDEPDDDPDGRFRVAMSVFNVASILLGVVTILVLAALLISLFNWLSSDIQHSMILLQSNLQ